MVKPTIELTLTSGRRKYFSLQGLVPTNNKGGGAKTDLGQNHHPTTRRLGLSGRGSVLKGSLFLYR